MEAITQNITWNPGGRKYLKKQGPPQQTSGLDNVHNKIESNNKCGKLKTEDSTGEYHKYVNQDCGFTGGQDHNFREYITPKGIIQGLQGHA